MATPVLVEVIRDSRVESAHRGNLICLDRLGRAALELGDVDSPIYPRSALKPAQAVAMLRAGAPLEGKLLAIAAGSHSGGPEHVSLLTAALTEHGLEVDALQCPADAPYGTSERLAWANSGGTRQPIIMNCSGKHTGMLLTCLANQWPTRNYLDIEHPLQQLIAQTVEELCEEEISFTSVDGCGAPLHMVSLHGLARLARALALAAPDTPEGRVAAAMRAYPGFVSGKGRDTETFMLQVPGFLTKEGAEGVQIGALQTGEAFAFKIEDGSMRARAPVVGAALSLFEVDEEILNSLQSVIAPDVLGGGTQKGQMRAVRLSK